MSDTAQTKLLEYAETHPLVLIGSLAVLALIIIFMYFNGRSYGLTSKKSKKKEPENEDEEIESLIASIKEKQK